MVARKRFAVAISKSMLKRDFLDGKPLTNDEKWLSREVTLELVSDNYPQSDSLIW